jgi:hypothetical protein
VTGCVCEKIAHNVAEPFFGQIFEPLLLLEKEAIRAININFQTTAQTK